jgi:purine nucleoside permease
VGNLKAAWNNVWKDGRILYCYTYVGDNCIFNSIVHRNRLEQAENDMSSTEKVGIVTSLQTR